MAKLTKEEPLQERMKMACGPVPITCSLKPPKVQLTQSSENLVGWSHNITDFQLSNGSFLSANASTGKD